MKGILETKKKLQLKNQKNNAKACVCALFSYLQLYT